MAGCFSCCWKDVRLKRIKQHRIRSRLAHVSVVVERMYDWSFFGRGSSYQTAGFSCCWKDVRLKLPLREVQFFIIHVSVVVERMYDWSSNGFEQSRILKEFQLLLKGCTIEACSWAFERGPRLMFQLLLKGCTIEATVFTTPFRD